MRLAGEANEQQASAALEKLCRLYWYPLYAFARRSGKDPETAKDLTQGFFAHLLEINLIGRVDRSAGRFRSYLLTAFRNYIGQEHRKSQAQRRGGGRELVSIDAEDAEGRYHLEPITQTDPEKLFEHRWAVSLVERVLQRIEQELNEAGKGNQFQRLQGFLIGDKGQPTYAEIAADLGLREGALRVIVHRMRERYREMIREEVAQTVSDSSEFEDEMRHFIRILCE